MTYEYLTHVIQYSAKIASTAFRDLGPRSVLFLEQSPEYIEIVVKAALKARLISKYQWTLLRTLLDEVAVANVADIFILFSNEEYDECANGHRKTGGSEHRTGSSLQRWNVEIEKLHGQWRNRQRAKRKYIFDVNARISKFARMTRVRKLMNVVLRFSNVVHGTAFLLIPAAASSPMAASKRSGVYKMQTTLSVHRKPCESRVMPPKGRSVTSTGAGSGTFLREMEEEGLHDETSEYQRRVRTMIDAHQRGPPQSTSEGLPIFQPRPRGVMTRRPQDESGRSRMRNDPLLGAGYQHRPRSVGGDGDIDQEREYLLKRLDELDRSKGAGRSGRGRSVHDSRRSHAFSESRYEEDRRGRESPRLERGTGAMEHRARDPSFRRDMTAAAARIRSAMGSSLKAEDSPKSLFPGEESEDEDVSDDNSEDNSDDTDRKEKIRARNKQRRKELKYVERAFPGEYGPSRYREDPRGSYQPTSSSYNLDEWDHPQGLGQHSSRQEDGWERQGQSWGGYRREEETSRFEGPYQHRSFSNQRNDDASHYRREDERYEEEAWGEGRHNELIGRQDRGGPASYDDSRWHSELPDHSTDLAYDEKSHLEEIQVDESSFGQQVQGKKEESGKDEKDKKGKRKSKEVVKQTPAKLAEKFPVSETASSAQTDKLETKKAPKDVEVSPSQSKKSKVSAAEMEAAVANIKREKITPTKPKLTGTFMSTDLKAFLVDNMNTEMDLEMDVSASSHFPKVLSHPPHTLSAALPELKKKVFEPQKPKTVDPAISIRSKTTKVNKDDSSVSLSQDEIDLMDGILTRESEDEDEAEEMRRILKESKVTAALDEERRKQAWAALGHAAPGPSKPKSPGKLGGVGREAPPKEVQSRPKDVKASKSSSGKSTASVVEPGQGELIKKRTYER